MAESAEKNLPDSAESTKDLAERSITAVLWGTLGTVLKAGVQLGAQIVLARILGPEQYGLFATAFVLVLFSNFFADVGLSYGLIQKKEISNEDIRFVFTWQSITGAVISLGLFFSAPAIASLVGDARLGPVLATLSPICLFQALRSTASVLLNRRLDFKTLNLSGLTSYTIGFVVVGIPLAMSGAQVEALVAASFTEALISVVIQYGRVRHPIKPLFWAPDSNGILRFGFVVLITNLLNWAMSSLDRIVIGRLLTMRMVGLYSTAYNIITMPALQAQAVLQSVLYSASTRVQDDAARLRNSLRTMLGIVSLVFLPMFTGVAVVSHTLIAVLYGDKWAESAPILGALALSMPFYLMMGMAIPTLWAGGKTSLEFKLQIPVALLWVVALVIVGQTESLEAIAWTVSVMFVIRALVLIGAALRTVDLKASACLPQFFVGVGASLIVVAAIWAVDEQMRRLTSLPLAWLLADMVAGAIALAVGVRLLRRWIDPGVLDLVRKLMGRLPGGLGLRVHRVLLGVPAQ